MSGYHRKILGAVAILVAAGAALLVNAARQEGIYYIHVDELLEGKAKYSGM